MLAIWDIQPGGGQNGHLLPPRKWVQEPKFSRKPAVSNLLPINWFNSCNGSCFPVWHTHCTRARFTVRVSCSGELAVYSCSHICLQGQVLKLASGLFYCWSFPRNNTMATNLLHFTLW